MKNRYFWEKRTCQKFRIIFESNDIIIGANRKNKFQTFRKDTNLIAFSRREVLELRLLEPLKTKEVNQNETKNSGHFGGFDLQSCFG